MINTELKLIKYSIILMVFLTINYLFTLFVLSNNHKDTVIHKTVHYTTYNIIVVENKYEINAKPHISKPNKNVYLLAHIINAEAGNQPYKGKIAVGNVIMNRVKTSGFPNTVKGVIYQKGQFSPVNNGSINNKPSSSAIRAAKDVINGKRVIGENVLFFYEPNISTDEWIRTRRVVTKIGDHIFAR